MALLCPAQSSSVQPCLAVVRNLENLLQLSLNSVSVNQETFPKKEKNDKICMSSSWRGYKPYIRQQMINLKKWKVEMFLN